MNAHKICYGDEIHLMSIPHAKYIDLAPEKYLQCTNGNPEQCIFKLEGGKSGTRIRFQDTIYLLSKEQNYVTVRGGFLFADSDDEMPCHFVIRNVADEDSTDYVMTDDPIFLETNNGHVLAVEPGGGVKACRTYFEEYAWCYFRMTITNKCLEQRRDNIQENIKYQTTARKHTSGHSFDFMHQELTKSFSKGPKKM